jgi:hypothetical protein
MSEIDRGILSEKYLEKQLDIDLLGSQIDRFVELDADWADYDYERVIAYNMERLDSIPLTFAASYNEQLANVSVRTPDVQGAPFDPTVYPEFITAVRENEQGKLVLRFDPEIAATRDMYLYFRWVPTDVSLSNRYLTVVAISKYSVSNVSADWVGYGAVALIIITSVLNFVMIAVICHISSRNSTKHLS